MSSAPKYLMIGNSLCNKGGMTSVIKIYRDYGYLDETRYLETTQDGIGWRKISMFISFLVQLTSYLVSYPHTRLVHIHVSQRGSFIRKIIVTFICKVFGKKVLWHMHGSEFVSEFHKASPRIQQLILAILNRVDCLIALSRRREEELTAIAPKARVTTIYNPCVLPAPGSIIRSPDEQGRVRFLFLGRYGQRKGVFDLLEAVRLLNDKRIHVSLYGDADSEGVRLRVAEANLTHQIEVNGWVAGEAKERVFQTSDVLLLPSYNEGLPMAILEAMSHAMPVITTPVGGIPEAVVDGYNGILVEPGDTQSLVRAMLFFLEHPERIAAMGLNGYTKAAEEFEHSKVMAHLHRLYEKFESSTVLSQSVSTG